MIARPCYFIQALNNLRARRSLSDAGPFACIKGASSPPNCLQGFRQAQTYLWSWYAHTASSDHAAECPCTKACTYLVPRTPGRATCAKGPTKTPKLCVKLQVCYMPLSRLSGAASSSRVLLHRPHCEWHAAVILVRPAERVAYQRSMSANRSPEAGSREERGLYLHASQRQRKMAIPAMPRRINRHDIAHPL